MDFGITREIKPQEGRVALLPEQVRTLTESGHRVRVERDAGRLSGALDSDYSGAGGEILETAAAVFAASETIVKVKEMLPEEYGHLDRRHILFTNHHTALNREVTDRFLEIGLTALSAEEMHESGSPNCPLAGEVGAFEGLRLCLAPHGGIGRHFMAHFGAPPVKAVIIGLGGVGQGAVRFLTRLGCQVVGLDVSRAARFRTEVAFSGANFRGQGVEHLSDHLHDSDMLINCVKWEKTRRDHLLTRNMLTHMKSTAVIVDISCDEAGAIESSRPTSWADPVYEVEGIRHFCVDNIPGAVPVAASAGYAAALLPFLLAIGEHGVVEACRRDAWLARGLTCMAGKLILEETGRLQNRPFVPLAAFLEAA